MAIPDPDPNERDIQWLWLFNQNLCFDLFVYWLSNPFQHYTFKTGSKDWHWHWGARRSLVWSMLVVGGIGGAWSIMGNAGLLCHMTWPTVSQMTHTVNNKSFLKGSPADKPRPAKTGNSPWQLIKTVQTQKRQETLKWRTVSDTNHSFRRWWRESMWEAFSDYFAQIWYSIFFSPISLVQHLFNSLTLFISFFLSSSPSPVFHLPASFGISEAITF